MVAAILHVFVESVATELKDENSNLKSYTFFSGGLAEGMSSSPPCHPEGHQHRLPKAMPWDFAHNMPASFFQKAFLVNHPPEKKV